MLKPFVKFVKEFFTWLDMMNNNADKVNKIPTVSSLKLQSLYLIYAARTTYSMQYIHVVHEH